MSEILWPNFMQGIDFDPLGTELCRDLQRPLDRLSETGKLDAYFQLRHSSFPPTVPISPVVMKR